MAKLLPIVFVGTKSFESLAQEEFEASLRRVVPQAGLVISSLAPDGPKAPSFGIELDGRKYTCFFMDFPVPAADLNVAVQAAYGWKGAAAAVAQSAYHWVVSPVTPINDLVDTYAMAKDVTAITAALLSVTSAEFIYWEAGDALSSPAAFREAANQMVVVDQFPILCWVQIRLLPGAASGKPGFYGARTTGLTLFDKPEVRLKPELGGPQEAFRAALDLIAYSLPRQTNVSDSDTVELANGAVFVARQAANSSAKFLEFSSYSKAIT